MSILLFVVLFFILTSFWGFYVTIKPQKILSQITPKDLGLEYEDVWFKTADGITLNGWFIPKLGDGDFKKTIILLHGYPANKGDILPSLAFLAKHYNLFLFDFRYLGRSEGRYSTAGAKEVKDLLAAVDYLKSRGIAEIGVWGFSMGGAVALMTAEQIVEIKAIISVSSYARLDLMARELYQLPLVRQPLGYFTTWWAKIILGIDPRRVSPVDSAQRLAIPVLLIHSINDEVISFSHALLLKEALKENPKAEFWFEENLVHGLFGADYQKRITEFFEKHL